MHCVEPQDTPSHHPSGRSARAGACLLAAVLGVAWVLSACQTPAGGARTATSPDANSGAPTGRDARTEATSPAPVPGRRSEVRLPPPQAPRSWTEARQQAARRMVAANPDGSYMGKPPAMLLAIPVMTVDLNSDGTVRNVSVMRYPSQARDTVNLAIAAIHRAAPYGDVSRLPKPWRFNETFLFTEDRKFKPMTLDQP